MKRKKGGRKSGRITKRNWFIGSFAGILVLAGVIAVLLAAGKPRIQASMTVIPFANLNGDTASLLFCQGFTNQIERTLDQIDEIELRPAPKSALVSQDASKGRGYISDIQSEYFVEGSIGSEEEDARIHISLVRTKTSEMLWSDDFTCPVDSANIYLDLIATNISRGIDVGLSSKEKARIHRRSTLNPEALDAYIHGLFWINFGGITDFRTAIRYFDQAIALDSGWSDPYLAKANALGYLYSTEDPDPKHLIESGRILKRAVALEPENSGAHYMMGLHYLRSGEIRKAKNIFARWESINNPKRPRFSYSKALWALGRYDRSILMMKNCHRSSPNYFQYSYHLGYYYEMLRDFNEAEKYFLIASGSNPKVDMNYFNLSDIILKRDGDPQKARELLENATEENHLPVKEFWRFHYQYFHFLLYERKFEEASEYAKILQPYYQLAIPLYFRTQSILKAFALTGMGNPEAEKAGFETAIHFMDSIFQKYPRFQNESRAIACLGMAYAGAGDASLAMTLCEKVMRIHRKKPNHSTDPYALEDVAWTYMKVGKPREAVKILKELLSQPGPLTTTLLEMNPIWDPIKKDPGYRKLIAKYQDT
jgi:tetratricopeptide (TPR) repeat protein